MVHAVRPIENTNEVNKFSKQNIYISFLIFLPPRSHTISQMSYMPTCNCGINPPNHKTITTTQPQPQPQNLPSNKQTSKHLASHLSTKQSHNNNNNSNIKTLLQEPPLQIEILLPMLHNPPSTLRKQIRWLIKALLFTLFVANQPRVRRKWKKR